MVKFKLRTATIAVFAFLLCLILVAAVGMLPARRAGAAEEKTYGASEIFDAGVGGEIDTDRPADATEGTEGDYYVRFTFQNGGKVMFDRNLALKWYESALKEESGSDEPAGSALEGLADPGVARYFSMTFAFADLNFKEFEIAFQGAEENITKDGISTNSLVFFYESDVLKVAVKNSSFDEEKDTVGEEDKTPLAYTAGQDIKLTFSVTEENIAGEYTLSLQVGDADAITLEDTFTNIGGNYLEYSSSSTKGITPITFTATLNDDAALLQDSRQHFLMKELNGQSFKVKNADGKIVDNAPAVLVLNEAVHSYRLGQRWSLPDQAIIDVCNNSARADRYYYMLKIEKDGEGNITYTKPNVYSRTADYKSLSTSTYFMPTSDTEEEEGYVSIRYLLTDGAFDDYYVYFTWYRANDKVAVSKGNSEEPYYLCSKCGKHYTVAEYEGIENQDEWTCPENVGKGDDEVACGAKYTDLKRQENDYFDYIRVDLEAEGPTYRGLVAKEKEDAAENEDKYFNELEESAKDAEGKYAAAVAYQDELDKVAAKTSAGDGAYLYLPSLRDLIGSEYADYRNLRFSIYYYKPGTSVGGTASSATSLRYNALSVEVDEIGVYRFRIVAQDSAGNTMKYYNEDNELVSVTSSNIWDIEGIPEFSCFIDYDGPSIEESDDTPAKGNRDKEYDIDDFEIVALEGYEKEYRLYYFNMDKLEDRDEPSYEGLIESVKGKEELGEDWLYYGCLEEIEVYNSDITEDDPKWDQTQNDYHWDPDSSLSFIPREPGYYFLKVNVKDAYLVDSTTAAWQVIDIGNRTDTIAGQSKWLQNNLTATVLFGISGVLLIAIIVLCVVKPSDKTVEEVDLDSLKTTKKEKK